MAKYSSSGWHFQTVRHSNARKYGIAGGTYSTLHNYEKPKGYKYYNHFVSSKGDYIIYSRDGKRFYVEGTKNSELKFLPSAPFHNITDAKKYLFERIKKGKNNFESWLNSEIQSGKNIVEDPNLVVGER